MLKTDTVALEFLHIQLMSNLALDVLQQIEKCSVAALGFPQRTEGTSPLSHSKPNLRILLEPKFGNSVPPDPIGCFPQRTECTFPVHEYPVMNAVI